MKQKLNYALLFAATATALIVTGTALHASEIDDKIEASFKKTHVYQMFLKDDAVKTNSKDGNVTLTGTVSEEAHKGLAQETVMSLPGVISVDNQLVTEAEAAAESKDNWIGRKVKITLFFHRNVDASKTDVAVKDGNVTLTGTATSAAQKELTSAYASDIEGVKTVKNEMMVVEPTASGVRTESEKIDDASVTAQVRTTLSAHRSTNSIKTLVVTRDGVVTLTGIAKNDAEKALVSKLVNDLQGVKSVDNQMTVEQVKSL